MSILATLLGEVCVLSVRSISSLKGTELLALYTILPIFIKIGQELFELSVGQTDTHTDRQIHVNGNNTSPKTKFLGEVIKLKMFINVLYSK